MVEFEKKELILKKMLDFVQKSHSDSADHIARFLLKPGELRIRELIVEKKINYTNLLLKKD